MEDPESQVTMGKGERSIQHLVLVDRWEERVALRETTVVLDEGLLASLGPKLDTDADLRPSAVETFDQDVLDECIVEVRDIRRRSITIQRSNQNEPRIDGLWLLVDHLLLEGLLDSLC